MCFIKKVSFSPYHRIVKDIFLTPFKCCGEPGYLATPVSHVEVILILAPQLAPASHLDQEPGSLPDQELDQISPVDWHGGRAADGQPGVCDGMRCEAGGQA